MQSGTCRLPSILPRCLGTQWAPGRGLDCAPREEGAGPTGRTGGHGLSGRQPLMQGLIAQSSGSSPGPWALRLLVTLWAGAGESKGKAGSTWTSCSDAGHAVPGSPLHPCLAGHRRSRVLPPAPVVTMVTTHLADASKPYPRSQRK